MMLPALHPADLSPNGPLDQLEMTIRVAQGLVILLLACTVKGKLRFITSFIFVSRAIVSTGYGNTVPTKVIAVISEYRDNVKIGPTRPV